MAWTGRERPARTTVRGVDLTRRPVDLAVALARGGSHAVVVGSTARLLRTGGGRPHDLDLAVNAADVGPLVTALASFGAALNPHRLSRTGSVRLDTWLGPVDVFAGVLGDTVQVVVDSTWLRVAA